MNPPNRASDVLAVTASRDMTASGRCGLMEANLYRTAFCVVVLPRAGLLQSSSCKHLLGPVKLAFFDCTIGVGKRHAVWRCALCKLWQRV